MPENVLRLEAMPGATGGGIRRMRGTSGSSSSLSSLSTAISAPLNELRRTCSRVREGEASEWPLMPSQADGGARSGLSSTGVWPIWCAAASLPAGEDAEAGGDIDIDDETAAD